MEKHELRSYIRSVFDKELDDLISKTTVSINNYDNSLVYPNSLLLADLFEQIKKDDSLKQFFLDKMCDKISNIELVQMTGLMHTSMNNNTSGLCFYTLVLIGETDLSMTAYLKRTSNLYRINYTLSQMIMSKDTYFNYNQLDKILNKIRNASETVVDAFINQKLIKIIINKKIETVKNVIYKNNIEINNDKKVVIDKMNSLGFNSEYASFLKEIDNYLTDNTTLSINSGMISNLRAFLSDLLKDIANKMCDKFKDKLPQEKESEMGNIRKYLKTKFKLTDPENKFISEFINILHSEGGHSFVSSKEYFRLSRNIGIEIAYFMLSKYEITINT
jgi:hypothetical protein